MKKKSVTIVVSVFLCSMLFLGFSRFENREMYVIPQTIDKELPFFLRESPQWASEKMEQMTLRQKIAQSFMVATWPNKNEAHQLEIDSLIQYHEIGGLIYFQGDRTNTKASIARFQEQSKVPLLLGMDAEWGSAMRLSGEERFPYGLTLGAANSPKHTETIAEAMGHELRELGIHINFAPVMDVNSNPNNPVIGFRSFGENPQRVGLQGVAVIKGLESYNVLSCMKHFPGHGDTDVDSHYDLPTVNKSVRDLDLMDWTPFKMGRLAGAASVMMAHLRVPVLDSTGTPSSLSKVVIQEYLRGKLKFSGLVISDALNMKAVADRYGKVDVVVKAYLAGNDILLYPEDIAASILAIEKAVAGGKLSVEEVNERCLRILRAKYYSIVKPLKAKSPDAHALDFALNQTYEKALTVLKNENAIPVGRVDRKLAIVTIGARSGAFFERSASYAKLDSFHAFTGDEAARRFSDTLTTYDVILVNVHAKSMLPRNNYGYPDGWEDFINSLPEKSSIIVALFGNPYVIKDPAQFTNADAILLGYENHPRAQERAAQLIFGGYSSEGKLPITLSYLFPIDFGVITPKASRLKFTAPEELGLNRKKLAEIDSIALNGIKQGAYPGCQIVLAKDAKVFYEKSFGYYMYDSVQAVTKATVYDIASITKIASSTISLMRLDDEKQFSLDSTLSSYLPSLTAGTPYARTKLRDMMTHQAGFSPWIPFYTKTLNQGKPDTLIYSKVANEKMNLCVADSLYMLNSYEDSMFARILGTELKEKKYKYSDLGYYFIKRLIEYKTSKSLDEYVLSNFYRPMGLMSIRYNPLNHYSKEMIAPTELDNYYRHQLVRGYVHDMGAAMTNGVGGHAGIFSNATDLAALMQLLLNNGIYGGERYLTEKVIKQYTSCQNCPTNRRGAGFDRPVTSLDGGPTCNLVSLKSYGHSGFTGTQVWADPEYGINYVFLSNRVYPSAENWKLVKMGIRTEIQRVVYEAVLGK